MLLERRSEPSLHLISVLWNRHTPAAASGHYLYSFLICFSKIFEISYALFFGYRFWPPL